MKKDGALPCAARRQTVTIRNSLPEFEKLQILPDVVGKLLFGATARNRYGDIVVVRNFVEHIEQARKLAYALARNARNAVEINILVVAVASRYALYEAAERFFADYLPIVYVYKTYSAGNVVHTTLIVGNKHAQALSRFRRGIRGVD